MGDLPLCTDKNCFGASPSHYREYAHEGFHRPNVKGAKPRGRPPLPAPAAPAGAPDQLNPTLLPGSSPSKPKVSKRTPPRAAAKQSPVAEAVKPKKARPVRRSYGKYIPGLRLDDVQEGGEAEAEDEEGDMDEEDGEGAGDVPEEYRGRPESPAPSSGLRRGARKSANAAPLASSPPSAHGALRVPVKLRGSTMMYNEMDRTKIQVYSEDQLKVFLRACGVPFSASDSRKVLVERVCTYAMWDFPESPVEDRYEEGADDSTTWCSIQ